MGKAFGLLLGSVLLSNTTNGLVFYAMPLLVLTLTTDPLMVAAPTAVYQALPAVFGLFIGAMVDAWDRRMLMVVAALIRILSTSVLVWMVVTGRLGYIALLGMVAILTIFEQVIDLAGQASVPEIVTDGNQLEKANGWIGAGQQVVQGFVAGPIAPLAFAIASWLPFALGASFAAVCVGLLLTLRHVMPKASGTLAPTPVGLAESQSRAALRGGLDEVRRNAPLRSVIIYTLATSFLVCLALGSYAYYLTIVIGLPRQALSVVLICLGVGGLTGSVTADRMTGSFARRDVLVTGTLLLAAGLLTVASLPHGPWALWLGSLGCLIAGLGSGWYGVIVVAARQRLVDVDLLGRVNGLVSTGVAAVSLCGTLLGGLTSRSHGRIPWLLAGVGTLLLPLLMRSSLHPINHLSTASGVSDVRAWEGLERPTDK